MANVLNETWIPVRDGDHRALGLYLRHYSSRGRRSQAPRQFVGPGEYLALLTPTADALFVWRRERFRLDEQEGVNCSVFRNEGHRRSSDLIREAARIAWDRWPGFRLFTFVDPAEVRSANPGYCFKVAGWKWVGRSSKGLHILAIEPVVR